MAASKVVVNDPEGTRERDKGSEDSRPVSRSAAPEMGPLPPIGRGEAQRALESACVDDAKVVVAYVGDRGGRCLSVGHVVHLDPEVVRIQAGERQQVIRLGMITRVDLAGRRERGGAT